MILNWPLGQAVKTPPFHGGNTGSNPVGVTNFITLIWTRGVAVNMPACHAGDRRFDPGRVRHLFLGSIAQSVEQRTENPRVAGSIPALGIIARGFNSVVECHLAKVGVAGSNPVFRSILTEMRMPGWRNWQTHRT